MRRFSGVLALLAAAALVASGAGCGADDGSKRAAAGTVGPSHPKPSATSPTATPSPSIDVHADPRAVARRADVPVLCWHQLRDWTGADTDADRPYIMPPATFRRDLDTLDRLGYHSITPDQLVAHLTTGAALPAKPVLLTFDDSDADQISVGLPELRRHHFTATFFIMTVVLGNDHYMTTDQVRELDRAGMTIGAHTWDHHRTDQYSGNDWKVQIDQPTAELTRIVGHPVRYFAYPFGVWNRAGFPHLRHAGFIAAFQLNSEPLDRTAPLYTLRRAIANPYWNTDQFVAALRHP